MPPEPPSRLGTRTDLLRPGLRPKRLTQAMSERVRSWTVRALLSPNATLGIGAFLIFVLVASLVISWSRSQPLAGVGRVMTEAKTVRVLLRSEDAAATEAAREAARQRTPRVYVADDEALSEIARQLESLPRTLASVSSLDEVDASIRTLYNLTDESLRALRGEAIDGEPSTLWRRSIASFMSSLALRPIVDEQTWQRATQDGAFAQLKLLVAGREILVARGEMLNLGDQSKLAQAIDYAARDAGVTYSLRGVLVARLMAHAKPTYRYDSALSAAAQNAEAESIAPVVRENPVGQVIYVRGDVLSESQYALYQAELRAYNETKPTWHLATRRAAVIMLCVAIGLAIVLYTGLFVPDAARSPTRIVSLAFVLLAGLIVAAVATVIEPAAAPISTIAPTMFVAAVLAVAYGYRAALAYGCLHGLLVCVAVDAGVGEFISIVTAIAVAAWQLRDIRDRNALLRLALLAAPAIALVSGVTQALEIPLTAPGLRQIGHDVLWAASSALLVAGVVLFLLPAIERAFGVATSLTLAELRDPKHPLLRELQIRAPGTYNHSLNVAAISEAASSAINADSLLTYVGALYHDIGKMNKPEYFVENQAGGPNKHDKLSPAMSLLIIIGHVKDGLELAREYGLPRDLQHFIESHHGTTLIEFFFHRAKQQALKQSGGGSSERRAGDSSGGERDDDAGPMPSEVEFRYPGPKPRTRESAILMIADAVESATRTLSEPTPARIDGLVRAIARKRLLDGQFDDSNLTLSELNDIVESISRSVASIYHGRVVYPEPASTATAS
ncbi:MAG: HDIG domain-containing protein [Planctomycetota bacterium]|nr:HDIG domain-containing protein [Planctomycetota bacterium]